MKIYFSTRLNDPRQLGILEFTGKRLRVVVGGFADRMLMEEPYCGDQLIAMWMGWA